MMMDRTSERRQINRGADAPASSNQQEQWVVLGAGRLGRGFLNLVANELSFRSLLVVAGLNTPQKDVDSFNNLQRTGVGYTVVMSESSERFQLFNYDFMTTVNAPVVIQEIAKSNTRVVSTSVGLEQLEEVVPLVAEGLEQRTPDGSPLLILVCENGRSQEGLLPSEFFKRELEKCIPGVTDQKIAILPIAVVDCAVPTLPKPHNPISIGGGTLWVEKLSEIPDVLKSSRHVKLLNSADLKILHTRKLYGYNSLHCIISVLGHYAGESFVDMIARDLNLKIPLEKIVDGLVGAICRRHKIDAATMVDGKTVEEYAKDAFRRLQRPVGSEFDRVDRALKKLGSGWYLKDGRIQGPICDLELLERPWESSQLTHALALCLYFFTQNIDAIRGALPWTQANRSSILAYAPDCLSIATAHSYEESLLHTAKTPYPLMEVVAQDIRELSRWNRTLWSPQQISQFLDRPITPKIRVVPKRVTDLKCVVFDLDEGLVATESLLYLVTRELIKGHSKAGRTISHDAYARHVGMSEKGFFEEMIREYQLKDVGAEELVKQRELDYRKKLEDTVPESLVKPGFKDILRLLAKQRLKLAVWSNASPERVQATLQHVELSNYFTTCKSPAGRLREKPAPDMLDDILTELNIASNHCIVVESSLIGVEAALSGGCFCILLVNDYTKPEPMNRRGVEVLPNSQALLEWFSGFFASTAEQSFTQGLGGA